MCLKNSHRFPDEIPTSITFRGWAGRPPSSAFIYEAPEPAVGPVGGALERSSANAWQEEAQLESQHMHCAEGLNCCTRY